MRFIPPVHLDSPRGVPANLICDYNEVIEMSLAEDLKIDAASLTEMLRQREVKRYYPPRGARAQQTKEHK
jgi:hypothetical protein